MKTPTGSMSLDRFSGLCFGMCALIVAARLGIWIHDPEEPKATIADDFERHKARLTRAGEIRSDTIPNLLLKAGSKEIHLGQTVEVELIVPQGKTEARLPLSAISTGTNMEWVKRNAVMNFKIAAAADRSKFRFDGRDVVFTGLAPGSYTAPVTLGLEQEGRLFFQKLNFKAGSGNCERYKGSTCVAAVGPLKAVNPVVGLEKNGDSAPVAAMRVVDGVPLKAPLGMLLGLACWRAWGRRSARAALAFLGPGASSLLGPLPVANKKSLTKIIPG